MVNQVPCPVCDGLNDMAATVCVSCGTRFTKKPSQAAGGGGGAAATAGFAGVDDFVPFARPTPPIVEPPSRGQVASLPRPNTPVATQPVAEPIRPSPAPTPLPTAPVAAAAAPKAAAPSDEYESFARPVPAKPQPLQASAFAPPVPTPVAPPVPTPAAAAPTPTPTPSAPPEPTPIAEPAPTVAAPPPRPAAPSPTAATPPAASPLPTPPIVQAVAAAVPAVVESAPQVTPSDPPELNEHHDVESAEATTAGEGWGVREAAPTSSHLLQMPEQARPEDQPLSGLRALPGSERADTSKPKTPAWQDVHQAPPVHVSPGRNRHIVLKAILAVVLIAGVAGGWAVYTGRLHVPGVGPKLYTLSLPDQIGGLTKLPDPQLDAKLAAAASAPQSSTTPHLDKLVGGFYGKGTIAELEVLAGQAGSDFGSNSDQTLADFAAGFDQSNGQAQSITLASASKQTRSGITYYCWPIKVATVPAGVCAWLDANILGAATDLVSTDPATVANLADTARKAIQH